MDILTEKIKISPSGLMDLENAAAYLGVSIRLMRKFRTLRMVPFVKLGGKLMIHKNDLDAFINRSMDVVL